MNLLSVLEWVATIIVFSIAILVLIFFSIHLRRRVLEWRYRRSRATRIIDPIAGVPLREPAEWIVIENRRGEKRTIQVNSETADDLGKGKRPPFYGFWDEYEGRVKSQNQRNGSPELLSFPLWYQFLFGGTDSNSPDWKEEYRWEFLGRLLVCDEEENWG